MTVAEADVFASAATRRISRRGALAVASFGAFLAFLDATIVNVAFPDIRASFSSSSIGGLSWVLNAYNIVFAAFLILAGRLADLVGRRRVFSFGIVLFTAASVVCAAAPSLTVLLEGRVIQAVGAALLVPASLALVVQTFTPEQRAHAISIWGAAAAVAAGLGPPLGGVLVRVDSWRLVFIVNVPLGILALAGARRYLIESRAPGRRVFPDLRGALLLAAGIALLTLGIVQGDGWGWTSAGVLGSFAGAVVAAWLFAWSSRNHVEPLLDRDLLRIRAFSVATAASAIAGLGFYAYLLGNVLWLHYVWGWSLLLAGCALAPAAVVAAAVAGPLGRLADVHGHRVVAVPGAVVWASAYVWYATQVGTHPAFLSQWLPGQVLSGVGVAATLPILGSAALAAVPGGRFAAASAVTSSARQLGGVLGVALLVVIVGTPSAATIVDRLRHGWWFSAAAFAAVAVSALLLRRTDAAVLESDGAELAPRIETAAAEAPVRRHSEPASLLVELPAEVQDALRAAGDPVTLAAGETLFDRGDPSDALYVVHAGRLEAVLDGDVLRELGTGEVVGELGVIAGLPRSATVRARRDTTVLRIDTTRFQEVLAADRDAQQRLAAALAARLQASRSVDEPVPAPPSVVSVVSDGEGDAGAFAALLQATLGKYVRVGVPGRVTIEGLDRAERDHNRVLLVADRRDDSSWREFCLRQADRLVVVAGDPGRRPPADLQAPSAYVVLTAQPSSRADLLAWWAIPGVRRVFVAEQSSWGMAAERLGERLAGVSVGLALAGGGARAFSGIGVLQEFEQSGIVVDRVSGTSLGSILAVLHASGLDASAVDAVCFDEFVRRRPFGDFTVPRAAIARGSRARAALDRHVGDRYFEELPREAAVVSADLLEHAAAVHRRGRVQDALRASFSLPGLFPPVRVGNSLHVDGGVIDNLPVSALEDDEGPIVAVNISAGGSGRSRSGEPRVPLIMETLLRSMLIGSAAAIDDARRRAAIVVTPDTRGIGLLEFHQIDRAIEAGRAAGRAAIAALAEEPLDGAREVT